MEVEIDPITSHDITSRKLVSRDGGSSIIFGGLLDLTVISATCSMVLLIALIVAIEYNFIYLHKVCEETPFEKFLERVEKELMIAGAIAFAAKIVLNASNYEDVPWFEMWAHSVEFVDLVLPVTSLFYVLIGLLFFRNATRRSVLWTRAQNLTLIEVLQFYYTDCDKPLFYNKWLSNIYDSNIMIEFRILKNLFLEENKVKGSIVDFSEYCKFCYEKYLVSLMTIHPYNWVSILIFSLLNLGRVQLGLEIYSCGDDSNCEKERGVIMFLFWGWILTIFLGVLAVSSRYYQLRLLMQMGVERIADFSTCLQVLEEHSKFNSVQTNNLIRTNQGGSLFGSDGNNDDDDIEKLTYDDLKETLQMSKKINEYKRSRSVHFFGMAKGKSDYFIQNSRNKRTAHYKVKINSEEKNNVLESSSRRAGSISEFTLGALHSMSRSTTKLFVRFKTDQDGTVINGKIRGIFFLSNPELYFGALDSLMIPLSFYCAMFVCNFGIWCAQSTSTYIPLYFILFFVSCGLSIALLSYSVSCASLLRCICSIDSDSMNSVVEQTDDAKNLAEQIRRLIVRRLDDSNPEDTLKKLFNEIDEDNSNLLSRIEFRRFLKTLKITFSKRKWRLLFDAIDQNNDDQIAFEEFFYFLYPENDVAQALEKRRLKKASLHLVKLIDKSKFELRVSNDEYEAAKTRIIGNLKLNSTKRQTIMSLKRHSYNAASLLEEGNDDKIAKAQRTGTAKVAVVADEEDGV